MAEKRGFEPPKPVIPVRLLSRKVLSATQPLLHFRTFFIINIKFYKSIKKLNFLLLIFMHFYSIKNPQITVIKHFYKN